MRNVLCNLSLNLLLTYDTVELHEAISSVTASVFSVSLFRSEKYLSAVKAFP